MALTKFRMTISILLISILLVSSSDNYGYGSTPDTIKLAPTYSPTLEPVKPTNQYSLKLDVVISTRPQVDNYKPNEANSNDKYFSSSPKPDYSQGSKPDTVKPVLTYSPTPKPVKSDIDYSQNHDIKQTPETKPKIDNYKSSYGSDNQPKSKNVKPKNEYVREQKPKSSNDKPSYGSGNKSDYDQPRLENVKPKNDYGPEQKPKPSNDKSSYGSDNKSNYTQSKPTYTYVSKQKPKPNSDKPGYGYYSKSNYDQPKASSPKPENGYVTRPDITIPKLDIVKPNLDQPELPVPKPCTDKTDYVNNLVLETLLQTGIQGLVLCKSGSKYFPIEGGVIRIACSVVDNNGYKKAPFTCLTDTTNVKGFFYKELPLLSDNLKLTKCKAFLESSPLETCKIPTDVNHGISGALLSSFNILHDKKVKLFSIGPFFYTSENTQPTPAGGY